MVIVQYKLGEGQCEWRGWVCVRFRNDGVFRFCYNGIKLMQGKVEEGRVYKEDIGVLVWDRNRVLDRIGV